MGFAIRIHPFEGIGQEILTLLLNKLSKRFDTEATLCETLPISEPAYEPDRKQYRSNEFLKVLHNRWRGERVKALGVTHVDLFAPELNFIFGEAELGGTAAVISIARLDPTFFNRPANQKLLHKRVVKEAVHELGHAFGLRHCPSKKCAMHFSNSLSDTDFKQSRFCPVCSRLLSQAMRAEEAR